MSNKKGGVAVEEISGIVTFMIFSVLAILIFYGCSISNAKNQYNEIKSLEDEIEANKVLNFFLEMPVDENMKVSDVIVEEYLIGNVNSPKKYDKLNNLANNYFLQETYDYWVLKIEGENGRYDSLNYNPNYNNRCDKYGIGETYIDKSVKLKVTLHLTKRCYYLKVT